VGTGRRLTVRAIGALPAWRRSVSRKRCSDDVAVRQRYGWLGLRADGRRQPDRLGRPRAEELLAERFARGDITEQEYRERLDVIRRSRAGADRRCCRRPRDAPGPAMVLAGPGLSRRKALLLLAAVPLLHPSGWPER
jgi:hypothetical protein